ncbi:MAG TPA: tRNA 4-thiouridine(8) synthase ThiI, partial [Halioglobus sp.]
MQFIVKYFSEIVMKSKPVRRQFVRRLEENLRAVLRDIDPGVVLQRNWDKLRVVSRLEEEVALAQLVKAMCNTAGVSHVLEVQEHPLPEL